MAEFSIMPIGRGESISHYVAQAIEIVEQSGLDYRVNPMGTVVEGSWDVVMGVIRKCHEAILKDSGRVVTRIVIDDRPAMGKRMEAKVVSVEQRLGRRVKK